ncbi:hypothetical protein FG386_003073 [Cryptosporidium ryanae]|uniref:uncharacterized protein n=1 Tax=Cryptosporidium ryanae TaxID=515981 RepID=UPI00351A5EA6|nr:hypothetical protein FG386_003073 [Cryptosporidium ryanae]
MQEVKEKEDKLGLRGNVKVIDMHFGTNNGEFLYKEYIGCIAYTVLIFTWAFSIFIPITLLYWFYVRNWSLFSLFSVVIIIPIIFRVNDCVPLFLKKLCNLFTKNIHYWTGPARIIIEEPDLESNKKQLLCIHPHGIFGIGSTYLPVSGIIKEYFYLIVTESLVWFQPIINVVLNSTVKLRGASHTSFRRTMMKGEGPLLMFPGGFHETILLNWGVDHIYVRKRFGFIKYCLKYNYSIRPVYVFGECLSFHQLKYFKKFRWFLNDFSLPSVVFCGETWWNPFLPVKNVPYLIVIGRPINCSYKAIPCCFQIPGCGRKNQNDGNDNDNCNDSYQNYTVHDERGTNTTETQKNTYSRTCLTKHVSDKHPSRELIREFQSLYIESLKRIYKEYSPYYMECYKENPNIKRYLEYRLDELKID